MCPLMDFKTGYIDEFTAVVDTAYWLVVDLDFVALRSSELKYLKYKRGGVVSCPVTGVGPPPEW